MSEIIEFCITSGAQALMLTAGDSHYLCLSDSEIAEVTRVTCEQAKGGLTSFAQIGITALTPPVPSPGISEKWELIFS